MVRRSRLPPHCSTCDPPHEQLLVRLGAGGVSVGGAFVVAGAGGLARGVTWQRWCVGAALVGRGSVVVGGAGGIGS